MEKRPEDPGDEIVAEVRILLTRNGALAVSAPQELVIALGMLELGKLWAYEQHKQPPQKRIVQASAVVGPDIPTWRT